MDATPTMVLRFHGMEKVYYNNYGHVYFHVNGWRDKGIFYHGFDSHCKHVIEDNRAPDINIKVHNNFHNKFEA